VARRKALARDLPTFDSRLLDGLDFCREVYALFEEIQGAPDGVRRLRLRPSPLEKKLLEELIPIARYIQARYREGRRIKVRWFAGSQRYDAILWSSGRTVDVRMAPKKLVVEVTMAVHPKDYLVRQLIDEGRPSFGAEGVSRDKKTGVIMSTPHVRKGGEVESVLARQILDRISDKAAKGYPFGTALVVACVGTTVILESEWNAAIKTVYQEQQHHAFREVFLFDTVGILSHTFFGRGRRALLRRRTPARQTPTVTLPS
jgi:hypothetical protein